MTLNIDNELFRILSSSSYSYFVSLEVQKFLSY